MTSRYDILPILARNALHVLAKLMLSPIHDERNGLCSLASVLGSLFWTKIVATRWWYCHLAISNTLKIVMGLISVLWLVMLGCSHLERMRTNILCLLYYFILWYLLYLLSLFHHCVLFRSKYGRYLSWDYTIIWQTLWWSWEVTAEELLISSGTLLLRTYCWAVALTIG